MNHDTIHPPDDPEAKTIPHKLAPPSVPAVFDPRTTEAPVLLVDAIERLAQVSDLVIAAGKAVEAKQDELGRGITEFTRVVSSLVEEVTALKLSVTHASNTMDAALDEMRLANKRVAAVEGRVDTVEHNQAECRKERAEILGRLEAVERWQREHRCTDGAP